MNTAELKDYKEFVVYETEGFRLRVRKWKCLRPDNTNSVEFVQECLRDGEVDFTSTYNFFLTDENIDKLRSLL